MKKIIFIDVDGTLVDYDNVLPLSAVKAIRKARANGHKVYISTGRSRAEVYREIWDIGLDGMIGGDGRFRDRRGSRGRSFSCVSAAGTDLMQSIMY